MSVTHFPYPYLTMALIHFYQDSLVIYWLSGLTYGDADSIPTPYRTANISGDSVWREAGSIPGSKQKHTLCFG